MAQYKYLGFASEVSKRKTIEWGRLEISSRKLEIPRGNI